MSPNERSELPVFDPLPIVELAGYVPIVLLRRGAKREARYPDRLGDISVAGVSMAEVNVLRGAGAAVKLTGGLLIFQ